MTYKVIQWGVGETGRLLLQQIVDNPDLELVGVYVRRPEKDGLDAGALCGRPHAGVRATCDKQTLIKLQADCVFFNGRFSFDRRENDDDVIALLSSGKNVISIVPGYFAPESRGAEIAQRIDEACRAGKATLFGTGMAPGAVHWLALVASGLCDSLEELHYTDTYDPSPIPRANIIDVLGMGKPADEFTIDSPRAQAFLGMFSEIAYSYAAALSCRVTSIEPGVRVGLATRDLQIAAGLVKKGTVAAVAWSVTATTDNGPRIRYVSQRIVQPDLPGWAWAPGWAAHIELKSKPSFKIEFPVEPADLAEKNDLLATVTAQVRAVPEVVAAPPGVLVPRIFGAWSPRLKDRRVD